MSTVFNFNIESTEKKKIRHPWQKTIKPGLENRIAHVHNSVNNPVYPKKKEKFPPQELEARTRFQVIGDRFSEEFIHCVKIVTGLYKYRWRKFEAPIIRGVTSVDWPRIQNDLRLKYGDRSYCDDYSAVVIFNDKYLGGLQDLKELVESAYIYYLMYDNKKAVIDEFIKFVKSSGRPCVYMHISVNNCHAGTLIFSLYTDIVPQTCENFLTRCKSRRGGYSGTPVHRIVKDSWIQCGGFYLKKSDLACENFIVPFDKRGVLAMANDGRDIDCSRQFFVILQPQKWMESKYVAFGQLIDGDKTLKVIEERPCWEESPIEEIIIYQTGILNFDCQDIVVNPHAQEYVQRHIENLFALGDLFYKELMERFDWAVEFRESLIQDLWNVVLMEIDLRDSDGDLVVQYKSRSAMQMSITSEDDTANQDFDVEDYIYEPEQYDQSKHSETSSSIVHEPVKNYYIPFTDVPDPDDVDSTYDMKKFLKGDYCLECDLKDERGRSLVTIFKMQSYSSEMFQFESRIDEEHSVNFDEDHELRMYLKNNLDRVSFAGDIIKGISRGYATINIFENVTKSEIVNFNDEELRRLRVIDAQTRGKFQKKVYISEPDSEMEHRPIKRRQTGFIHPEQFEQLLQVREKAAKEKEVEEPPSLERALTKSLSRLEFNVPITEKDEEHHKIMRRPTAFSRQPLIIEDDDENDDKPTETIKLTPKDVHRHSSTDKDEKFVRIDSNTKIPETGPVARRQTGFAPEDEDVERERSRRETMETIPAVLEEAPTLKDYRPQNLLHIADLFARESSQRPAKLHRDSQPEKGEYQYLRASLTVEGGPAFHAKKKPSKEVIALRKATAHSLRSYEYAKQRPAMTVSEYKLMNLKSAPKPNQTISDKGLRLPGDTPLYLSPTSSLSIGRRSPPTLSKSPPTRASVQKTSSILLPVVSEEIMVSERKPDENIVT